MGKRKVKRKTRCTYTRRVSKKVKKERSESPPPRIPSTAAGINEEKANVLCGVDENGTAEVTVKVEKTSMVEIIATTSKVTADAQVPQEDEPIEQLVSDESEDKKIKNYKILSAEKLEKQMKKKITEFCDVANQKLTKVRVMLTRNKWNVQRTLDSLFAEVESMESEEREIRAESTTNSPECMICLDVEFASGDAKDVQLASFDCGHKVCHNCLTQYVLSKVNWYDEPCVSCFSGCNKMMEDGKILEVLTTVTARDLYRSMMMTSFIDCDRTMRWCPTAGCGRIIKVVNRSAVRIKCVCKRDFCFECNEKWHETLSCDLYKKWMAKYKDERAKKLVIYINSNTKDCPTCNVMIEKNDGKNVIKCVECKTLFCWQCYQVLVIEDIPTHESCKGGSKVKYERIADLKLELQRFAFFYNSYEKQVNIWSKEEEFTSKIYGGKRTTMFSSLRGIVPNNYFFKLDPVALWVDFNFVKKVLVKCRKTLVFSLIFLYFVEDCNEQYLLKEVRTDLENSVDQLSTLLDGKVTEEQKLRIMNSAQYCKKRRKVLLNNVSEGYEKDWWKFAVESRIDTI